MGAFCQTENFATDALWVKLGVSKTANWTDFAAFVAFQLDVP